MYVKLVIGKQTVNIVWLCSTSGVSAEEKDDFCDSFMLLYAFRDMLVLIIIIFILSPISNVYKDTSSVDL